MINIIDRICQPFQSKTYSEVKTDFTKLLPSEIIREIFSYLNAQQLARCLRVNKKCKVLANHEALWNVLPPPTMAIGEKEWKKYFGEIGKEPPLPKDIHKFLKSPCPFSPGKKIEETHMLVLVPESFNGTPLTLAIFAKLVKAPKEGKTKPLCFSSKFAKSEHCNRATAKSHWVLMTKDVLKGSNEYMSDEERKSIIARFAQQTGVNYEVPNVLDATICIFMYYLNSRKRLFRSNYFLDVLNPGGYASNYTSCQEMDGPDNQMHVGSFSPVDGLCVVSIPLYSSYGVAAMLKIFSSS